jgi:quinol-cytochrome oxidoreductase complex cytochrome b subunit
MDTSEDHTPDTKVATVNDEELRTDSAMPAAPSAAAKKGRVLEPGDARYPGTDRMIPAWDGIMEHDHYAEWEGQPTIRFFPDHFISEGTAMILLLCLYSVLCIFFPAFLEVRSNPAVTPTGSKPAWYFLFLYQFLHFVPPLVGTLTPMALLVLLGAWPFLDRNPSRKPRRRVFALTLAAVTVITILTLTYLGAME